VIIKKNINATFETFVEKLPEEKNKIQKLTSEEKNKIQNIETKVKEIVDTISVNFGITVTEES
jgi:hypothetical protein